jgi:transcriptional regulator with XRE-family HTH domain
MNSGFSNILYLLRSECRYSQRKVAGDLGVSQALLSHYENGIREPKLDFVIRVCGYYNVSADYILGRTDEKRSVVIPRNTEEHRRIAELAKRLMEILDREGDDALRAGVARYFAAAADIAADILEAPEGRYDPMRDAELKTAEAALRRIRRPL